MSKKGTLSLKGLAILMIIVQHLGQNYHVGVVNPLGPIGVFIFLFCSGYGLQQSYKISGTKRYFRKKLVKVYIPFLVSILLFCVFTKILKLHVDINIFNFMFLIDLPQGSFWYLRLQFYWYFVFWILKNLKIPNKANTICMMGLSVLTIFLSSFNALYIWQVFSFPMGVIAADYMKSKIVISKKIVGIVLIFISSVIVKKLPIVDGNELGLADISCGLIMTITGAVLLIELVKRIKVKNSNLLVFEKVGGYSYELYLSHILFLDYLKSSGNIATYLFITLFCFVILAILNKIVLRFSSTKV